MAEEKFDGRCPICGTHGDNHEQFLGSVVTVAYCPGCGVPNFFNMGSKSKDDYTTCIFCHSKFLLEAAGDSVVNFFTKEETVSFTTPKGLNDVELVLNPDA